VRTSTLLIIVAGLLAATTFKWSELRLGQTLGDIYRESKAGRPRTSAYRKIAGFASLALIIAGMYLAFSGE
jgi:hypothetical protein